MFLVISGLLLGAILVCQPFIDNIVLEVAVKIATIVLTFLFVLMLVVFPINYYGCKGNMAKHEACRVAWNQSESNFKSATLICKVVDSNKWLAKKQYWADTWLFGYMYPDEISKVEPIKVN